MANTNPPEPAAENEAALSNPDRILTLITWARIVSWALFGVGGIMIVLALFQAADNFGKSWYDPLETLLVIILSLLPVFLGLVLQFLIEGARLVMDIEKNTRATPKA